MFTDDREAIAYSRHVQMQEELTVFGYIREIAKLPYSEAYQLLHLLLIEGLAPGKPEVAEALKSIVMGEGWEKRGRYFINRALYTIRNPWRIIGHRIEEFQRLLDNLKAHGPYRDGTSRLVRRLRHTMTIYIESNQYHALLMDLERLPGHNSTQEQDPKKSLVYDRFRDLYFLHEALATSPDLEKSERKAFRQSVADAAWDCRNTLYKSLETKQPPDEIMIEAFGGEQGLFRFLEHIRPDRENSLWKTSKDFVKQAKSMKIEWLFDELIPYLMSSPDSDSAAFSQPMSGVVQRAITKVIKQCRAKEPGRYFNQISLTTFCCKLFEALIIESEKARQNVLVFQRMLTDHGAAKVSEMLLRITFLVPTVRFAMEKQLAIVFHLNIHKPTQEVPWLMTLLEHIKVGLAMNAKQLYNFYLRDFATV